MVSPRVRKLICSELLGQLAGVRCIPSAVAAVSPPACLLPLPAPASGHVKGMRVPAKFYADPKLLSLGGLAPVSWPASGFSTSMAGRDCQVQGCSCCCFPGCF